MSNYYFNITYQCNMRCVFCAADTHENDGELSLEDIQTSLKSMDASDGGFVVLNGGEPTVHPQLVDIVRAIKQYQYHISLFSNGLKLSSSEYLSELIKAGVEYFSVPLYTLNPQIFSKLTKKDDSGLGAVQKAILSINEFVDNRKVNLTVKVLVLPDNYQELVDIASWLTTNLHPSCNIDINGLIMSNTARENAKGVDYDAAAGYIDLAINKILDYNHKLHLESIPLCKVNMLTILRYLHSKRQYEVVKESQHNYAYNSKSGQFENDAFNTAKNYCSETRCKLYGICRINPSSDLQVAERR